MDFLSCVALVCVMWTRARRCRGRNRTGWGWSCWLWNLAIHLLCRPECV